MLAALFLLAGIVLGDVAKREILQLSGRTLDEVARQSARELAMMMSERYRNVALLAEHPELRGPVVSLDRKRALLESFRRTYPEFSWIGLTNAQTVVVLSTHLSWEWASRHDKPCFARCTRRSDCSSLSSTAVALLLGWWVVGRIVHPMRKLARARQWHGYSGRRIAAAVRSV